MITNSFEFIGFASMSEKTFTTYIEHLVHTGVIYITNKKNANIYEAKSMCVCEIIDEISTQLASVFYYGLPDVEDDMDCKDFKGFINEMKESMKSLQMKRFMKEILIELFNTIDNNDDDTCFFYADLDLINLSNLKSRVLEFFFTIPTQNDNTENDSVKKCVHCSKKISTQCDSQACDSEIKDLNDTFSVQLINDAFSDNQEYVETLFRWASCYFANERNKSHEWNFILDEHKSMLSIVEKIDLIHNFNRLGYDSTMKGYILYRLKCFSNCSIDRDNYECAYVTDKGTFINRAMSDDTDDSDTDSDDEVIEEIIISFPRKNI